MVRTKICSSVWDRQSLDNGTGTIWVPSSFGGGNDSYSNDSCEEVGVNDCPTGYKSLHSSHYPKKRYVNDTVKMTGSDLKRYKCWEGGQYSGTGGNAVKGTNHGLDHTYSSNSLDTGWGDEDNFGRPCFKDTSGWNLTDPTNGRKGGGGAEYNADACCGFVESVRRDVQEKYCHPNTCFIRENDKTKDVLSNVCQDRLVDKCKNWSFIPDTIGFEDDRCATPLVQIAKQKQTSVTNLTAAQSDEDEQARQTASIDDISYRNYGQRLCTNQVFLDDSDSGEGFEKKQKCIQWCRNNPNQCRSRIKNVCATIYEKTKALPDVYPDAIKENDSICACHWPEEFYTNILEFFKKKYNVGTNQVDPDRKCLYRPCGRSDITNEGPGGDSYDDCPPQTLVSCIQTLNIDFRGAEISDGAEINTGQEQACGSLSDTAADVSRRPTNNDNEEVVNEKVEGDSSDSLTGKDDNYEGMLSLFVFAILIISVVTVLIIYLK